MRPPTLDRVFDREFLGRKWKHVIEPRVTYRFVSGVNNFARILRFDERDILSNTNEVEYGVVNRLYAKRTSAKTDDCTRIDHVVSHHRPSGGGEPHPLGASP